MYQLSVGAAYAYTRKCMDELFSIETEGMVGITDDLNLRKQVEDCIVEAVVKTHKNAPSDLLEGVMGAYDISYDLTAEENLGEGEEGVLTITMKENTLRIVSIKAYDSDVVVCNFIPEDSAEGRKQLNKYVRGVSDDPRVVIAKVGHADYQPILRYYTTTEKPSGRAITLTFIPYPEIVESIVEISPRLEYAVLNEIVAMILDNMNMHDKATLYRNKSAEHMAV